MVSLKVFYSAGEAAEKLSTGSPKLNTQDIYRLAEDGRLPVCFHRRGHVGLFDLPGSNDPLSWAKKWTYWSGYLRSNGVQHALPQGLTGKMRDVLYPTNLSVAMPAGDFEAIAVPDGQGLHPTDENGLRQHILVRPCDWLFHIDDLEKLMADKVPEGSADAQPQATPASPVVAADAAYNGNPYKVEPLPLTAESVPDRDSRWLTLCEKEERIKKRGAQSKTVRTIVESEGVTEATAKRGIQNARKRLAKRYGEGPGLAAKKGKKVGAGHWDALRYSSR